MPVIFISYRRADSDVIAGRIRDRLARAYRDDSVFMDIDNIPFGVDFRNHVKSVLMRGDIMVAVIGKGWLARQADGRSRLADETDPVRVEIEAALQRQIPIIPVLVQGAEMPKPAELPATMEKFAFYNAADVDPGRDFHPHMDRLIRSIDRLVKPASSRARWRKLVLPTTGLAATLLAALGIYWTSSFSFHVTTTGPKVAEQSATASKSSADGKSAPRESAPSPAPASSAAAASWRVTLPAQPPELNTKFEALNKDGFSPQTISGYPLNSSPHFVTLWSKDRGSPRSVGWNYDPEAFQKRYEDRRNLNYRPIFVSAFEAPTGIRYSDVWERSSGTRWDMKWNLTAQDLRTTIDDMRNQGLRLVHVYGYPTGGISRFAAIFEKSEGEAPILSLDVAVRDNQKEWETHGNNGYIPKAISGYSLSTGEQITTLWEKGRVWSGRYGIPIERYEANVEEFTKREMRLVYLSAYPGSAGVRLNMVWTK
jgi:hypothetical protein